MNSLPLYFTVRWTKGNDHIAPSEFIELIPNGGLRLLDLRITDSGVYVCQGKVPVQQGIVSVNIVRLHVGTSIQEQLLQQGGKTLVNRLENYVKHSELIKPPFL